jgi:hypothetical protein
MGEVRIESILYEFANNYMRLAWKGGEQPYTFMG